MVSVRCQEYPQLRAQCLLDPLHPCDVQGKSGSESCLCFLSVSPLACELIYSTARITEGCWKEKKKRKRKNHSHCSYQPPSFPPWFSQQFPSGVTTPILFRQFLPKNLHLVCVDMPGHEGTTRSALDDYSIMGQAKRIHQVKPCQCLVSFLVPAL